MSSDRRLFGIVLAMVCAATFACKPRKLNKKNLTRAQTYQPQECVDGDIENHQCKKNDHTPVACGEGKVRCEPASCFVPKTENDCTDCQIHTTQGCPAEKVQCINSGCISVTILQCTNGLDREGCPAECGRCKNP